MSPRVSPHPTPRSESVPARLRWWAVVLAVLGFTALLVLVAGPAHAAGTPAAGPLAAFTGRLPTLLPHLTAHLW